MHAIPRSLVGRDGEWIALDRFVSKRGRLGVVYGPRRSGKSFLLDAYCTQVGGWRYQAIGGTSVAQLDDVGRALGRHLGVGALRLDGWVDAIDRIARLDTPVVVLDELPYLTDAAPELAGVLQRFVDAKRGPSLVLCGSALSAMHALLDARAPLFGRASLVIVPAPFQGRELAGLWGTAPSASLWVDSALGGLPGYRAMTRRPGGLDAWMTREVLAATSPFLDAAEATLGAEPAASNGVARSLLTAIAAGNETFANIARVAGVAATALSRPMKALERAGLLERTLDPLRERRDRYVLADPHLRFWLTIVAPHRPALAAGRADHVWRQVRDTTWPAQIVGPRWEAVVRTHILRDPPPALAGATVVGSTVVADRAGRRNHQVDIVAMRGGDVAAIGEAKLRRLTIADADRLRHVRTLLGADDAPIVLASATGVDAKARADDVVVVTPADVYG